MNRATFFIIFTFLLLISSCLPQESLIQLTSSNEGGVIIFLQPMPNEASNLRFIVETISAVRDDGNEIPLTLLMNNIKGVDLVGRQRRIGSGSLPEGLYRGLSVRIQRAFLQGEEGETSLLPPDAPIIVQQPFSVKPKTSLALFLTCNSSGALTDRVRFKPSFSLTLQAKGFIHTKGYLSDTSSNSILVFNKKRMQVTGMISTGTGPMGMVIDESRGRMYVAASGDDTVEVIDLLNENIIGRINLNFQDRPVELALTPDGRTLLSVNEGSNTVSILDALSLFERTRIRVGENPVWASVDPSGLKAYIMNSSANSISVIDLTQNALSASLGVENAPLMGDFNLEGNELYVIFKDSPNLVVIDPRQSTTAKRIFIGSGAISIKADLQRGLILVGKRHGGEISVIDPFSSMAIDAFQVGGNAAWITIDDEENSLYAVLPDKKALQKIGLTSKQNIAELEAGDQPHAVVLMSER
jgi:YVTN family beta-propeller protein